MLATCDTLLYSLQLATIKQPISGITDNGKIIEDPSFSTTGHVLIELTYYKNLVENKPTQWEIGQPSDFFFLKTQRE